MKKIFTLLLLILIIFAYLIFRKSISKSKEKESAFKVQTEKAKKNSLTKIITLTGEMQPIKSIDLKSSISGRIENMTLPNSVEISENIEVQKEDIIASIDSKNAKIKLDQAIACYDMAQSSLKIANITFEDRKKDKLRMENLFKEGAITKKQLETTLAEYERCSATLEQMEAKLKQAEALKEEAMFFYEETFVKAPFSGVIAKKYVAVGDLVSPATPLVKIIPMDAFKLIIKIPDRFLSKIKKGKVETYIDAYPEETFYATVSKIYPMIDPLTKMATVELHISNQKCLLYPGMFACVKLIVDQKDDVLTIPKSSLINKKYLFVVEENQAILKEVTLGMTNQDVVEITSGVTDSDEIVILGQQKLTSGCKIEKIGKIDETAQNCVK